ncbi:integrase core domain protein, partial [Lasius niger]
MERGMVTDEENRINDKPLEKSEPYREAIGSLLYLATISRPNISFAVNYLSRFSNKPMVSHWKMVKRVFQYLKGTAHHGIFFNGDTKLVAYTDSDYGGDRLTGHSTSGILIILGGPIVWCAQKQRLVATSTAEAEYRAAVSSIDDI